MAASNPSISVLAEIVFGSSSSAVGCKVVHMLVRMVEDDIVSGVRCRAIKEILPPIA